MKTLTTCLLISAAALPLSCLSQPGAPAIDGIPIKPIQPAPYLEWDEAFNLDNGHIRVVVVPSIGRILHISADDEDNLLNVQADAVGRVPPPEGEPWRNYGGDWLWPVSQDRWKELTGADWPPPSFVNDLPGTGHAWTSDDGAFHAVFEKVYPAPLHVTVTRTVQLPAEGRQFTIDQRIVRTGDSTIPVCLWQISQVRAPEAVVLPMDPASRFPDGYVSLFDPPLEGVLDANAGMVTARTAGGGEYKLGTDSTRGWIGARTGNRLLLQHATQPKGRGLPHPDGGCTTEVYSNDGLGYAEIESLSPIVPLKNGESLRNRITVSIHTLPEELPDGLAGFASQAAGEAPPEPSFEALPDAS